MKLLPVIALTSALMLTACSEQVFKINGSDNTGQEEWSKFFVYGIQQTETIDAAGICGGPSKIATVASRESLITGLLNGMSGGIFSPREYRVTCVK
ncbi:MAG: hypothetical protein QM537_09165 [Candidatus Symbiobacter sp.]|nr:hypothetical protein [Candidatus Symbiobacter sp.]